MFRRYLLGFLLLPNLLIAVPACYTRIESSFFRSDLLSEALAFHGTSIPQSAWVPVKQEIALRARNVPKLVKELAAQRRPNPFEPPFDPAGAEEVLQIALKQTIAEALIKFNITNPGQVIEIFRYLQERQINLWNDCFGEQIQK